VSSRPPPSPDSTIITQNSPHTNDCHQGRRSWYSSHFLARILRSSRHFRPSFTKPATRHRRGCSVAILTYALTTHPGRSSTRQSVARQQYFIIIIVDTAHPVSCFLPEAIKNIESHRWTDLSCDKINTISPKYRQFMCIYNITIRQKKKCWRSCHNHCRQTCTRGR